MPKYLSDQEVYDHVTRTDRPIVLMIECPHTVIEHLPAETLAHVADDMPEKGFTITIKVIEPKPEEPKARKRKR